MVILLLHRPASYGRIVVGVGEGIGPPAKSNITIDIRPFHRIITFKTGIKRRNLICPEKYTPVRAIVEHNRNTVYHISFKARRGNETDLLLQQAFSGKDLFLLESIGYRHRYPVITLIRPNKKAISGRIAMQPHILTLFVVTTACKHNRRQYPYQIFHNPMFFQ